VHYWVVVIAELVKRELSEAERVLLVADSSLAHAGATRASNLREGQTPASGFDALLWQCEGEPLQGLRSVRARLAPHALLLLVVRTRFGLGQRVLRVALRRSLKVPQFESVCAAPILSGFLEPSVLFDDGSLVVLRARLADAPDALDDFFSQPA
jgi:hypothetical protein